MKYVKSSMVAIALLFAGASCDCGGGLPSWSSGADDREDAAVETVVFESDRAPYSVRLPEGWRLEPEGNLNEHADLRASKNDRIFLIVIPQSLPSIEGVDSPGVGELKRASLERMRENVQNLRIQREGPVTLESADAVSVFARARTRNGEVQYVTTYVTKGTWGYQIVAWGPVDAKSEIADSVDRFVRGWQFQSDSVPSSGMDARSDDTSEQSSD